MIISQTAIYALKAMLCLAEAGDHGPMRVDDVASNLDVPRNYLSKILHVLARNGVLASTRGPGGGFILAVDPSEVRLIDVIRHFDDVPEGRACLLGREQCSDADPCPAHTRWKGVSSAVHDFFAGTTLADLSADRRSLATLETQ